MNALNADINGKYTVISLFAGCGGSSLGYKMAGYKELLAVDFNKNAVETFKLNFPEIPIWQKDITEIKGEAILEFCNIKRDKLDVLDGSPPCQGFSTAGKRKVIDPRNDLVNEYIRLISEIEPKVFIMENVSGMVKGTMKGLFIEYLKKMKALNYNVKVKLLNTKYYNVPQSRQRLIFIGVRNDLNKEPIFPIPNRKLIVIKEVIKDLELKGYDESINHIWINEKEKDTLNYKRVLNTKQGHYYKSLRKRIKSNMPCVTIHTGGGGVGIPYMLSNSFCHYKFNRTLSIRELARCHTYPDDFIFKNDMIHAPQQIGNSVPPLFMKAIAETVKTNILD